MANKRKISATALFSLLAVCAFAQTATTTPVGFVTLSFRDGTASPKQDTFYLGLTDTPAAVGALSGKVTSLTATTLTSTGAGWSAGGLSAAAAPYMVRITSGAALGTTWQISTSVANTTDTVTLSDAGLDLVGLGVVANDTFEVLPLDTLSTLFAAEMLSGASAAVADNVAVWNGSAWVTFYYHTNGHWYRSGTTPPASGIGSVADNVVLRPDSGFIVTRRGPAKNLVLVGRAPASDLKIRFGRTKDSFIGTFPVGKTLAQLALQTTPGWVASPNAATADKVSIWNGGAWTSFFYTGTQWQRVGGTTADAGNAAIQTAERPLLISKVTVPPAPVYLTQQKPY